MPNETIGERMKNLSSIALAIQPSKIRQMFDLAYGKKDVISFALGEPDFSTSQNILDAACIAIRSGKTKYTQNAGIKELREVCANNILKEYGIAFNADNEIIVTAGGMGALSTAFMVLLNPGDEVILTNPGWTNYIQQISIAGGIPRPVEVFEKDEFMLTSENLEKAINEKTKALVINSPANPTGSVISNRRLEEIAEIVRKNDLYVISDDVYRNIIFEGNHNSIAKFKDMRVRTIIINSFSKSYSMTGFRVGIAAGPKDIIGMMVKYQENLVSCANSIAQYAAIEALSGSQQELRRIVCCYKKRRDIIVEEINKINGLSCVRPKGTFYLFVNIKKAGISCEEFAVRLFKKKRVVIIPGTAFGSAGEGYIRLSFATSEENIRKGIKRIKGFISNI